MGHRDKVKKLGRTKPHREAMLANMAMYLFTHGGITTTDAKAKALKPLVDRLISTGKEDTLHAKRMVARTINNKEVFKKLFTEIIPQFSDRTSGFTRVVKLGVRRGDGAPISVVELLTEKVVVETDDKGKKSKKAKSKDSATKKTAAKPNTSKKDTAKTAVKSNAAGKGSSAPSTKNK